MPYSGEKAENVRTIHYIAVDKVTGQYNKDFSLKRSHSLFQNIYFTKNKNTYSAIKKYALRTLLDCVLSVGKTTICFVSLKHGHIYIQILSRKMAVLFSARTEWAVGYTVLNLKQVN